MIATILLIAAIYKYQKGDKAAAKKLFIATVLVWAVATIFANYIMAV